MRLKATGTPKHSKERGVPKIRLNFFVAASNLTRAYAELSPASLNPFNIDAPELVRVYGLTAACKTLVLKTETGKAVTV